MNEFLLKAEALARSVHQDQFRRDGVTPYIVHVESVVSRLHSKNYSDVVIAAGWLHDSIEMSNPPVSLKAHGQPIDVIQAVRNLTRFLGVSYKDYLVKLVKDPIARTVKIFDMISNLADTPTNDQLTRYASGISFIMSHGGIL